MSNISGFFLKGRTTTRYLSRKLSDNFLYSVNYNAVLPENVKTADNKSYLSAKTTT